MAINKLLVMGKSATAKRLFRTQGIAGITATVKTKYFDKWLGKEHNWCYGKLVETWGNVIKIDGCAFSLDSPAIPTRVKSSFLFDEYEKPERQAIPESNNAGRRVWWIRRRCFMPYQPKAIRSATTCGGGS